MKGLRVLTSLRAELPFKETLIRLGYVKQKSLLSAGEEEALRAEAEAAVDCLDLKGAILRLPFSLSGPATVEAGGCRWQSRDLARSLAGCRELCLMAATGGAGFSEQLDRLLAAGEMKKAVIWNAAASEAVDAALDRFTLLINRELVKEGKRTAPHRFSPGFGDLDLWVQKDLVRLLNLETLGVRLNDSCILTPEKSVTAIIGIRSGIMSNEEIREESK
ncbi:MAG: hypothetical protein LBQ61_00225 [Spirochaetales bacterium]|jgi:hypothetical protein|nr:hypothetical protein [Spirochaetales bacterium]